MAGAGGTLATAGWAWAEPGDGEGEAGGTATGRAGADAGAEFAFLARAGVLVGSDLAKGAGEFAEAATDKAGAADVPEPALGAATIAGVTEGESDARTEPLAANRISGGALAGPGLSRGP